MNGFSTRMSAAAIAVGLALGTPGLALAEGAAAGGNESAGGQIVTRRGNVVTEGHVNQLRSNADRGDRVFNDNRDRGFRTFRGDRISRGDRDFRRDRGFYRRGDYAYYNGHRGYRHHRHGYREHNGWWFPLAAFAAGALIAGAAAPAPAVAVPANPHVDWCMRTYRSYNPYDNTFQPYRGPRAYCISPYS